MNEEPKNIWRRPWKGPGKTLGWLGLLAGAVFVILFLLVFCLGKPTHVSETLLGALVLSLILTVVGALAALFIRWLCNWRNFRRFLFGIACVVTLIALFYVVEGWRGKRAWENHKRQWEAKGEKFTIAALVSPMVPDEKNFAMTPLLKPVSDFTRAPSGAVWRDTNALARLEKLLPDLRPDRSTNDSLSLGSLEKGTFADLETCRSFYRGNTNYPQPATAGSAAQDILVALGKFDPAINELREAAATRPYSKFSIEYNYEPAWGILLLPHLARMKGLCQLTHMRAVAELEAGQSAEAFTDLKLGLRLSDSMHDEPLLIDHLVRVATLAINLQTVREGLVRRAWTDTQLAELEKYLASVNLLAEYKLAMRGERACNTSGLDWLRRQGFRNDAMNYIGDENGGSASAGNFSPFPGGWFYQNMLTISEMHQDFTLASVDEKARLVFPEVSARLDSTLAKMPYRPYTIFARMLMPAVGRAVAKSGRMQTYVDAARLACALERHRLANSKLPDTLDALTPQFIEKIPTDVIDGKPLRYRPKSDGGYVIYSVGWNKTDDGGDLAWTKDKKPHVDATKGDWLWQSGELNRVSHAQR